jgi:hypothetical protein
MKELEGVQRERFLKRSPKECMETKVRDEGAERSLRRTIFKTETKESGSSKENDFEKSSLELPDSLVSVLSVRLPGLLPAPSSLTFVSPFSLDSNLRPPVLLRLDL